MSLSQINHLGDLSVQYQPLNLKAPIQLPIKNCVEIPIFGDNSPLEIISLKEDYQICIKKLELQRGFEIIHKGFFDPNYRFYPSVLFWDYGQNAPRLLASDEIEGPMIFGRDNSRIQRSAWDVSEVKTPRGAINMMVFMHSESNEGMSYQQQLQEMKSILSKTRLRAGVKKLMEDGKLNAFWWLEEKLKKFKQKVRNASREWDRPICLLAELTIGVQELKVSQEFRFHKSPFVNLELEIIRK